MTGTPSSHTITINGEQFVPYITAEAIQQRISELATRINQDMKDDCPIFICVLNGAFMVFADLIRQITIDCEVDFLKLSSYGEKKISSGQVELIKDLNCEVEGRNIVLVEDIVDTGISVDFMKKWIGQKNPKSLRIVSLLHKPAQTKIHHTIDYVGFTIEPRFVIGFGLDFAQKGRNLPSIHILAGQHDGELGKE